MPVKNNSDTADFWAVEFGDFFLDCIEFKNQLVVLGRSKLPVYGLVKRLKFAVAILQFPINIFSVDSSKFATVNELSGHRKNLYNPSINLSLIFFNP